MRSGVECIDAVKRFEGCRLFAYRDSAGILTIGYGHTRNVTAGKAITQKQADELFNDDMAAVEKQVESLGLTLTQGQFNALCSFVFNLGIGNLKASTLLKLIKAGAAAVDIQNEFGKWVYSGGKKLSGLVKRREWEARQWVR